VVVLYTHVSNSEAGRSLRVRIQNAEMLVSHGNVAGRRLMLEILEAGLQGADPYNNTRKLIRLENRRLTVGYKDFEPKGTPKTGDEVFDLSKAGNIYVFGAGKGCQRVAKAIEDILGDRLTGGHVIDKKGHGVICKRIGVTLAGHPIPDDDNPQGCERIMEMTKGLRKEDLVFTVTANGISSLLTMPVPGVSIEDLRKTVYLMQIDRGAPTGDLNPIRNHLDLMKSGRVSKYIHPATMIHILAIDPGEYDQLMHRNLWLHFLPDFTTFEDAVQMLKKWNAWDVVPESVRKFLLAADPRHETVKAKEFERMNFRIFGVMPDRTGMIPSAMKKAKELGINPIPLAGPVRSESRMFGLQAEASQAGLVLGAIANTIEVTGQPFEPPCALFTTGELLVTVGQERGVGGRNQEFALSAARRIAGCKNIVIGAVDSDGTDGPGTQFYEIGEGIHCLAGGIVDGETMKEAQLAGVNIQEELRRHNSTPALWKLRCGVVATPNISVNDLCVALVMGRG
jgi:glycerate-2-kinase